MPTQPARNLLRRIARAIAIAILLARPAFADKAVELTLEQARIISVEALKNGDPTLAIEVAKGLLKADRRDPLAYFVIAQAHAGLGQPNLARRAAAYAYRYSSDDISRFQAGQLAARMAYEEGKPSLAQVWLRRTARYARTENDEAAIARDYRTLRAINPWAFSIRTDLRPSSNVNNGSDTALNIIDGRPDGGTIPVSGRALSGLIGSVDLASSYRLRSDQTSTTSVAGRLYMQRVALSADARDLLDSAPVFPGQQPVRNSDFASTYAEISLRHGFAMGDKGGTGAVEFALGESWYAQERSYRFARLQAERKWRLSENRTNFTLFAVAEDRTKARYTTNDALILGIGTKVQRRLGNGDKIGLTLALRDTNAVAINGTFSSASMRTSYTMAKPIGPARLSAGLVLGYSDYPEFNFTFPARILRRQDKSIYADISLFFDRYDYAGFAPLLRFRAGRKYSNFSRFESREFSVSLSIQSKF